MGSEKLGLGLASKRTYVLALALLAGAVTAAILLPTPGNDPSAERSLPAPSRDFMSIFDANAPLLQPGRLTTIPDASKDVGYPLYRPSGADPTEVWVSPDLGEAGLRYDSSLVLLYSTWPSGTDVPDRYRQQASDWGMGHLRSIGGNPA